MKRSRKQSEQCYWRSRKGQLAMAKANITNCAEVLGLKVSQNLLTELQILSEENDKIARLHGLNIKEK